MRKKLQVEFIKKSILAGWMFALLIMRRGTQAPKTCVSGEGRKKKGLTLFSREEKKDACLDVSLV